MDTCSSLWTRLLRLPLCSDWSVFPQALICCSFLFSFLAVSHTFHVKLCFEDKCFLLDNLFICWTIAQRNLDSVASPSCSIAFPPQNHFSKRKLNAKNSRRVEETPDLMSTPYRTNLQNNAFGSLLNLIDHSESSTSLP